VSVDETQITLRGEGGKLIPVTDETEIKCDTHGLVTTWGDLDDIQRLAVEEGIDVLDDMPCLLHPSRRNR